MAMPRKERTARGALALLAAALLWLAGTPAQAADPIKVGVGLALTGAGAPAGKMLLAAIELWRDDINSKGGLLGRPVEVVHYDDQSAPSNVPGLYIAGTLQAGRWTDRIFIENSRDHGPKIVEHLKRKRATQ